MEKFKSVKSLLESVRSNVERSFPMITLEAEVTNWSKAHSGHYYFSLNDNDCSLQCALFKGVAWGIKGLEQVKDGDKLVVSGSVTVFPRRSSVQLIVKSLVKAGSKGSLKDLFEKTKKKLAAEGLFDLDKKIKIPRNIKKIALITSAQGAAVQDFIKIYMRRAPSYHIVVIPSLVQGDAAEQSLIDSMKKAKNLGGVDCIVLTRGGGSLEDLWAFNSEALAREISDTKIPVVSAVGHEINFSISDFVADLRCETPSAAAEILSTNATESLVRFKNIKKGLLQNFRIYLDKKVIYLNKCSPLRVSGILEKRVSAYKLKLSSLGPESYIKKIRIAEKYMSLDEAFLEISNILRQKVSELKRRLDFLNGSLKGLDPKLVLKRGYSYVEDSKGNVLGSKISFNKNKESSLKINFHDGKVKVNKEIS